MPKKRSCVLLADRHHGLTEGVRGLLETAFGTVVMVADEASLIDGAGRLQPDVVVVDLSLAQVAGLGWLRTLRQRCPDLKVILISVHDEESVRAAAMAAGADALFIETHPDPDKALSDAACQIPLDELRGVLERCVAVFHAAGSELHDRNTR